MATELLESFSVNRFKDQSAMALSASDSAGRSVATDAINMKLASQQLQSNANLAQAVTLMGNNAEHQDAVSFLAVSRKIVEAMPEKTVTTTNNSSLFSTPRQVPAVTTAQEHSDTPQHTG